METSNFHYSVLLNECIEGLAIKKDGKYVDCTLGRAGHSSLILKSLSNDGMLYAFDQDKEAIDYSEKVLSKIGDNFELIKSNFENLKSELTRRGIEKVDGILMDLGVSSPQLDNGERGFSYHFDSRLDMRMDQDGAVSAYDVVNTYDFHKLLNIFTEYGEEKFAKQIARKIEAKRQEKPIETTFELVEIIKSCYPVKARLEKHPAKQVFQAIRIEVNKELEVLKKAITDGLSMLNGGGRMAIITFHSLEDRIVKLAFKELTEQKVLPKGIHMMSQEKLEYKLITKKPIVPSQEELEVNNRSRSAKLRVIEKL